MVDLHHDLEAIALLRAACHKLGAMFRGQAEPMAFRACFLGDVRLSWRSMDLDRLEREVLLASREESAHFLHRLLCQSAPRDRRLGRLIDRHRTTAGPHIPLDDAQLRVAEGAARARLGDRAPAVGPLSSFDIAWAAFRLAPSLRARVSLCVPLAAAESAGVVLEELGACDAFEADPGIATSADMLAGLAHLRTGKPGESARAYGRAARRAPHLPGAALSWLAVSARNLGVLHPETRAADEACAAFVPDSPAVLDFIERHSGGRRRGGGEGPGAHSTSSFDHMSPTTREVARAFDLR